MAAVNLLTANGLTKRFGGLTAVRDVSIEVPKGQIRALIGPNGAGKSTLVGLLSGRIDASFGTVSFDDRDITGLSAHQRVSMGMAYTFQITSVFSRLSLYENVALAVRQRLHAGEVEVALEVREALDKVNLADRSHDSAGDLSYGHQRLLGTLRYACASSQFPFRRYGKSTFNFCNTYNYSGRSLFDGLDCA